MPQFPFSQAFGSMLAPVRAGAANLLLNSPDGWVADQGRPVWWVGAAQGSGPIGPNGPWSAGQADAQAVVSRLVSLLVDPLTTGPFRVRRWTRSDPQGLVELAPRWLNDPHLLRPDSRILGSPLPAVVRLPRSVFWRRLLRDAVVAGSGFLLFVEDQQGQPVAGTLRTVPPMLVETAFNGDGSPVGWRIADMDFDGEGRSVAGDRLIRIPNPHTDVGVFAQHPGVFRLSAQIDSYASGSLRSGVPAGYLKVASPQFTKDDAEKLKEAWLKAHGGDRRSIAVLNATTEFQALSGITPVDAALAEVKRLAIADVAYAFGIAPEMIGVSLGGSMTYSNQRDWFQAHRDLSLSPWIAAFTGALSALLPEGSEVEVNLDAYQQPSTSEVIADGNAATGGPLMTVDEWRTQRMSMPPMPVRQEEAVPDADA